MPVLSEKWGFLHTSVGECLPDKGIVRAGVGLGDQDKKKSIRNAAFHRKYGKNDEEFAKVRKEFAEIYQEVCFLTHSFQFLLRG